MPCGQSWDKKTAGEVSYETKLQVSNLISLSYHIAKRSKTYEGEPTNIELADMVNTPHGAVVIGDPLPMA